MIINLQKGEDNPPFLPCEKVRTTNMQKFRGDVIGIKLANLTMIGFGEKFRDDQIDHNGKSRFARMIFAKAIKRAVAAEPKIAQVMRDGNTRVNELQNGGADIFAVLGAYGDMTAEIFAEFLDMVDLQSIIDNAYQLIAPYVEQDPTAFYTKEEFEQGVQTLKEFCSLRSESISMQLEEGETTEEMDYVDASGMTLSDMGSMSGGMGREGGGQNRMPGNLPFRQEQTQESGADESTDESSGAEASGEPSSRQSNQTRREFPSQNSGQLPEGAAGESAADSFGWLWIAGSALLLGVGLLAAKLYR